METVAKAFKPKIIVLGGSAYPRDYDYKIFREVADSVEAFLMMDMAHTAGLIAAKQQKSPFEYCDVVTTTTHKTLRGPRAGVIFFKTQFKKQIQSATFPGLQGGPHNNNIAAIATNFLHVKSEEFVEYAKQIIKNTKALAEAMIAKNFKLISDGSDNHLIL